MGMALEKEEGEQLDAGGGGQKNKMSRREEVPIHELVHRNL